MRHGPESRLMGFDVSDPANAHKLGTASPHFYARSAAPLFLAHGDLDRAVPPAQALRLYHALCDAGRARRQALPLAPAPPARLDTPAASLTKPTAQPRAPI